VAEGQRRIERALAADDGPTSARAKALDGASSLALASGDLVRAKLRAQEALSLHRKFGDAWGTARSVLLLGIAACNEADFETAQRLCDESVGLFRELGDQHWTLEATRFLAWACDALGDPERARGFIQDNLCKARAIADERNQARALTALAELAVEEGRNDEALEMLAHAYRLYRALGDLYRAAITVYRLADALASGEEPRRPLACSRARRRCTPRWEPTPRGSRRCGNGRSTPFTANSTLPPSWKPGGKAVS
jgi:tetratricopeptide (TPR) repeat protein